MTTLEQTEIADAATASDTPGADPESRPAKYPWLWTALTGFASGALSLAPVLLLALVALWTDPRSSVPATTAVGVGALGWLALHGTSIDADGATISILPLLLGVIPLACALAGARRILGLVGAPLTTRLLSWWIGYAACSAIALWLTAWAPARPIWWTLAGPFVVVPALAVAWVLVRTRDVRRQRGEGQDLPVWRRVRMPLAVRRAVAPGLYGAVLLLTLGALAVVAAVALNWHEVVAVHDALTPGPSGSAILILLQVGALPNLAIWALSFLAGPGFQLVDGMTVSWAGVQGGVLPLIPVLGVVPEPGPFSDLLVLTVLIPVAAGAMVARWCLGRTARLAALSTKLGAAVVACGIAAVVVTVLDLVGGDSLGAYRLSSMGPSAPMFFVVLLGELLLGAVLVVLWDAWRLRR